MEWQDEGVVLAARRHGETDAVASLMTFEHGRHLGLVKGGGGRRSGPWLQPGNRLQCGWRARLPEHLGLFTVEPVRLHASLLLEDPLRLAAAASACALLDAGLPERDPHPDLYAALLGLLGRLAEGGPGWPEAYVRFELVLLAELGFGLDLASCAVTGETADLAYVSPRTGRSVSVAGAGVYRDRLLPLPGFLAAASAGGPGEGAMADAPAVADALRLTGHFLTRHVLEPLDRAVPQQRDRLVELWRQGRAEGVPA